MKRIKKSVLPVLVLVFALALGLAVAPPADACVICGYIFLDDIYLGYGWVFFYNIVPLSENRAMITIPNYVTTGAVETPDGVVVEEMEACAVAHTDVPAIASVTSAGLYDSVSGELLYRLRATRELGPDFASLADSQGVETSRSWIAFYTEDIPQNLENGRKVHFNLVVTLKAGYTVSDLARQLERQGAFATSAARDDGSLDRDHFTVFSNGITNVVLSNPVRGPRNEPQVP